MQERVLVGMASVLTTCLEAEAKGTPVPESSAYLALGSDIDLWYGVQGALGLAQLATFPSHQIVLTKKGRELAQKCVKFLEDNKAAKEAATK